MSAGELAARMEAWLASEYRAVIFENEAEIVGYALFRESADEIYLRQLFIQRNLRRLGFGRTIVGVLRERVWSKEKRFTVEVLVANRPAVQFWRAVGYRDYALTLEIMPEKASV
jgi:predicted acetyltransferase